MPWLDTHLLAHWNLCNCLFSFQWLNYCSDWLLVMQVQLYVVCNDTKLDYTAFSMCFLLLFFFFCFWCFLCADFVFLVRNNLTRIFFLVSSTLYCVLFCCSFFYCLFLFWLVKHNLTCIFVWFLSLTCATQSYPRKCFFWSKGGRSFCCRTSVSRRQFFRAFFLCWRVKKKSQRTTRPPPVSSF